MYIRLVMQISFCYQYYQSTFAVVRLDCADTTMRTIGMTLEPDAHEECLHVTGAHSVLRQDACPRTADHLSLALTPARS